MYLVSNLQTQNKGKMQGPSEIQIPETWHSTLISSLAQDSGHEVMRIFVPMYSEKQF